MNADNLEGVAPEIVKKIAGLGLAQRAAMLQDQVQVLSDNRKLVREHYNWAMDETKPFEGHEEKDEMMHIGDIVYNSGNAPPSQSAAQSSQQQPQQVVNQPSPSQPGPPSSQSSERMIPVSHQSRPRRRRMSATLQNALLAGTLLATGGAGGLAVPLVMSALSRPGESKERPAIVLPNDDRDTQYEFRLVD